MLHMLGFEGPAKYDNGNSNHRYRCRPSWIVSTRSYERDIFVQKNSGLQFPAFKFKWCCELVSWPAARDMFELGYTDIDVSLV